VSRLAPLLILASLLGLWANSPGNLIAGAQNDFLAFYCGGTLSGSGRLYDAAATYELHQRLIGEKIPALLFIRLPYYAFLLKPLAWFPYLTAFWIWTAASFSALAYAVWKLAPRAPDLPYLCAFSLPLLCGIANGQDVPFLMALIVFAWTRLERGQDLTAGLALALGSIKLHLFLPVYAALWVARRHRAVAGIALGGLLLVALSFASEGFGWPWDYLAMINRPVVHQDPAAMGNFVGLLATLGWTGRGWDGLLHILGLGGLVMLGKEDLRILFPAAIATGLLSGRHSYLADFALLLPAYAILVPAVRHVGARVALQFCTAPFLYFALLSGPPWTAALPVALLVLLWTPTVWKHPNAVPAAVR